jgi:hypothetical protein
MGLDEIRDGTANGRAAQCLVCELDWLRVFQGQLAGTGRIEKWLDGWWSRCYRCEHGGRETKQALSRYKS